MMKKLISLGLVCVFGSTLIAACSDNTAKNNTKESSTAESSIIQSSTSKQSSDQNNESKQAKDQNKDGKKVNYKVESTYKKELLDTKLMKLRQNVRQFLNKLLKNYLIMTFD